MSRKVPSDSLTEEAGTFLAYTTKWVEKVDLVNLFRFNEEEYMSIRSMEYQTLNKDILLLEH